MEICALFGQNESKVLQFSMKNKASFDRDLIAQISTKNKAIVWPSLLYLTEIKVFRFSMKKYYHFCTIQRCSNGWIVR